MSAVDSLAALRCPHPDCSHFGKSPDEGGKFWLNHRVGKHKVAIYRCAHCRRYFSERRGTLLEQSRLPPGEALAILDHLREGNGIRRTARLTHHATNTVSRLAAAAGLHGRALHDALVRALPCRELQADEQWGFVGKKRKPLRDGG